MEKTFDIFCKLVSDQYQYGGKKYGGKSDSNKETTDTLFEQHGKNWLFGTIDKYTYRFTNMKREKDLLKIACYMYILWLKRGFFVQPGGINDPPINTTVKVKEKHFQEFVDFTKRFLTEDVEPSWEDRLKSISRVLKRFSRGNNKCYNCKQSNNDWTNVNEPDLANVFIFSFRIWEEFFKDKAGQDTDTWIEKKK